MHLATHGITPASARPQRFLVRLGIPADPVDAYRAEGVLAFARVFVAIGSLVAIYLDPTEPSRFARLAYLALVLYVAHSFFILVLLRLRQGTTPRFPFLLHSVDVFWPAFITTFTEGPNSPFFLFFFFVLLAAAYRWGMRETLLTAGVAIALIFSQATLLSFGPWAVSHFLEGTFQLNRLIIRSTYLLIIGFLVGYLSEAAKLLRAETATITRVLSKTRVESGLRGTLQGVLDEFLRLFGSEQALLVLQEVATGKIFLWENRKSPKASHSKLIQLSELPSSQERVYFFPVPGEAWHAIQRFHRVEQPAWDVIVLDGEGRALRDVPVQVPEAFRNSHSFSDSLLSVAFQFRQEWRGCLFLLDPRLGRSRIEEVRFAQNLFRQAFPAVYNVYLVRRIRAQVGTVERARVARELHDGVIQSLSAAVMKMELLRRPQAAAAIAPEEELTRLQQLLQEEIVKLRELMEEMKPLELNPNQLLGYLAGLVENFHRETGIHARFISDLEEISLRPRVCREVGQIAREALVNVRWHSGAHNVIVRFTSVNGRFQLTIDDDGCGFPFAGRFSHEELEAARKGPLVIKERVRSIGGQLVIESNPGQGARLEISIPQR